MTPAAPRYLSAASTDQGFVRKNNEDRVYADDVRGLFVVIDGMGGHEAGEHAADIALERLRARLERQTGTVEQRIREAITLANNAVFETAQQKPEWKGMACVLTLAMIEDGRVVIGHVGDSRLYRIRRGKIEKVTHDHSPVGEREDSGELTEQQAMQHPRRNEVYRDVGSEEHTPDDPDFIELAQFGFDPESALLLCTDGLSDAISSQQILEIVEQHAGDRRTAVRALIEAAIPVGKDNVSAVLVEGERFAASFRTRTTRAAAGEITGRLTTPPPPVPQSSHWYLDRWLWLFGGVLLGAAAMVGVWAYVLRKPPAPPPPQTLTVEAPSTIAETLARARAGDTVIVAPGTYRELVHLKDGVDLIARLPHEAIIDGGVQANGIQHCRLEGFEVHGGEVAVRINDSDVAVIRDEVTGASAAGIEIAGNSRGEVVGSNIHNNGGPGIVVAGTAIPDIENNTISANAVQIKGPGLLVRSSLRPRITGNVFSGNGAEAIWLSRADPAAIGHNFFIAVAHVKRPLPPVRIVPATEVGHESR